MNAFSRWFVFVRVAECQRNLWKPPEHIAFYAYLHFTLLTMNERDTAAEKVFDMTMQITLKFIQVQRFKQNRVGGE